MLSFVYNHLAMYQVYTKVLSVLSVDMKFIKDLKNYQKDFLCMKQQ